MVKKKSDRRSKTVNPELNTSLNLKSRRDVTDNINYVKGVRDEFGSLVIPPLDERAKAFLNAFNKEYYNADFSGDENIHVTLIDNDTVEDVKNQIRDIKVIRKRIWEKSPNTTTEDDRDLANFYTEQIEDMEYFLDNMFPKRAAEHANNKRNYDLLNYAKRSNKFQLESWDELRDNELNEIITDFSDIIEKKFEEED